MTRYHIPTQKEWKMTWLIVGVFTAVTIGGAILIGSTHPRIFLVLVAAMLFSLVYWHASTSAYRCPGCGHEFEISVFRDFASPHTPKSKYLRCPKCQNRDWAIVLRKD